MIQAAFLFALHLVGIAVNLSFRKWLPMPVLVLSAFPFGLSIWVLVAALFAMLGLPFKAAPMMLSLLLVGVTVSAINIRQSGIARRDQLLTAAYSLLFLLAIGIAETWNFTVLSYDSFKLIEISRIMAQDGGLLFVGPELSSWGFFVIGAHGAAAALGLEYFHALQPVFAFSFVAIFFYFSYFCLRTVGCSLWGAVILASAITLALFSTYFMFFQFFYIHNSFPSACYLFIAVVSLWLGLDRKNDGWFYFSILPLLSFALLRTEGPLIMALFLFLAFTRTGIAMRTARAVLLPMALAIFIWYVFLISIIETGSDILTPTRAVAVIGPLLVFSLIRSIVSDRLLQLVQLRASVVFVVMLVMVAVTLTIIKSEHMLSSLEVMTLNMHYAGRWGWTWHVAGALFLVGLIRPRFAHCDFMLLGILAFLLTVYILVFLRPPYRLGWGDSANRILTHILPIIFLYDALRISSRETTPESAEYGR